MGLPEQDIDDLDKITEPDNGPEESKEKDLLEFDMNKTKVYDVLKKFEDQTRIAVIRRVPLQDPQIFIDIKDKNGKILESVELYVNPGIKKITVILDVKK